MQTRTGVIPVLLLLVASCGSASGHAEPARHATTMTEPSQSPRRAGTCPEGLVGWWRFEKTDGPVLDECGRHDGTATDSGVVRGAPGRDGGALDFDGSGGHVVIEGSTDFDFLGAATIELWLRVPAPVRQVHDRGRGMRQMYSWPAHSLVSRGTGNRDNNVLSGTSCGNVQIIFSRDDGTGSTNVTTDCHFLPASQWVHIAFVNDGQRVRLYRNAEPVAEGEGGYLGAVDGDLYIGRRSQNIFPLQGAIDELKWWTVARTKRQICEDAGGRFGGTCVL